MRCITLQDFVGNKKDGGFSPKDTILDLDPDRVAKLVELGQVKVYAPKKITKQEKFRRITK